MLRSALRALINNLFLESYDTTFMGNEKNYQNINCFFSPIKLSLNGLLTNALRALVSISLLLLANEKVKRSEKC